MYGIKINSRSTTTQISTEYKNFMLSEYGTINLPSDPSIFWNLVSYTNNYDRSKIQCLPAIKLKTAPMVTHAVAVKNNMYTGFYIIKECSTSIPNVNWILSTVSSLQNTAESYNYDYGMLVYNDEKIINTRLGYSSDMLKLIRASKVNTQAPAYSYAENTNDNYFLLWPPTHAFETIGQMQQPPYLYIRNDYSILMEKVDINTIYINWVTIRTGYWGSDFDYFPDFGDLRLLEFALVN